MITEQQIKEAYGVWGDAKAAKERAERDFEWNHPRVNLLADGIDGLCRADVAEAQADYLKVQARRQAAREACDEYHRLLAEGRRTGVVESVLERRARERAERAQAGR